MRKTETTKNVGIRHTDSLISKFYMTFFEYKNVPGILYVDANGNNIFLSTQNFCKKFDLDEEPLNALFKPHMQVPSYIKELIFLQVFPEETKTFNEYLEEKDNAIKNATYMYKDKEYPNLEAVAEDLALVFDTLLERLSRGWNFEDAVREGLSYEERTVYRGKAYPTVEALCETYGLPITLYNSRKEKGWNLDKIITTPISGKTRRHPCEYNGKVYPSYYALAKELGLNYKKTLDAINNGETIVNCANDPTLKLKKDETFLSAAKSFERTDFFSRVKLPDPVSDEEFLELMYSTEIVRF